MPVNKKAHYAQLPDTPFLRTRCVTRFGVSVEKVVATILMPSNHHGMLLPARKKDSLSASVFLDAQTPINNAIKKYPPMMDQSNKVNIMISGFIVQTKNGFISLPLSPCEVWNLNGCTS